MLRRKISEVLVEQIHANRQQPRKHFEEEQLAELRDSICQFGILQPLILRREDDGTYMILAGERRFRAAVMAGLSKVPALVREASEEEAGMIALVENIQRENLGYIEEAKAYQALMEAYQIPQQELARRLGKNQSTISNKIRILNLPEDIQRLLVEHRLTERHARALLKLDDDMRRQVIEKVIRHQFNVRQTEKLVEECLMRREKMEREKNKVMRISCKLYINTLKKAFNEMDLLSKGATFRQEDTGESYVVKITIPKTPEERGETLNQQNDIQVASGQ